MARRGARTTRARVVEERAGVRLRAARGLARDATGDITLAEPVGRSRSRRLKRLAYADDFDLCAHEDDAGLS